MAIASLTTPLNRNQFFHRTILNNLRYWQGWAETSLSDASAFERECDGLIKAISFALDLENESWPSASGLILTLSSSMERGGHWSAWEQILSRALLVTGRLNDKPREVNLLALLGRLSFQQNRFQEAVAYYRRTIKAARSIGDRFNEARACTNLGYYFIEQGYRERARVLCYHALTLFEQIGSDHGRAHTENHLGILYIRQPNRQQAQHHLEQAMALWQAMNDTHGLMHVCINFGALYNKLEEPAKAIGYLEQALHHAQMAGDKTAEGLILNNVAIAYKKMGALDRAEEHARQAEIICRNFSDQVGLTRIWITLGLIYIDQRRWNEASHYLNLSLEQSRALQSRYTEIEALIGLTRYELARNNQPQAAIQLAGLDKFIERYFRNSEYQFAYRQLLAQYNESCTTIK